MSEALVVIYQHGLVMPPLLAGETLVGGGSTWCPAAKGPIRPLPQRGWALRIHGRRRRCGRLRHRRPGEPAPAGRGRITHSPGARPVYRCGRHPVATQGQHPCGGRRQRLRIPADIQAHQSLFAAPRVVALSVRSPGDGISGGGSGREAEAITVLNATPALPELPEAAHKCGLPGGQRAGGRALAESSRRPWRTPSLPPSIFSAGDRATSW